MPFGPWQMKSLIVGFVLAAFVLPRVMAFIQSRNS
jgi:hypothetical protein